MLRERISAALLTLTLLATTSLAGIRGPGKYAGVVIFDRWDTCYLYSGIYLMYVSRKTKERLRRYQGRSILIYAKEVFQPINPGDGLIGNFKLLGLARSKGINLDGVSLTVVPRFADKKAPTFQLTIKNRGTKAIYVLPDELALTLIGVKGDPFSPSDGKSEAWLTRQSIKDVESYFKVEQQLPDRIEIQPNAKATISMSFRLPKGKYDFLCGYGGGVHEEKGVASNIVAFSVDEGGKARLDHIVGRK